MTLVRTRYERLCDEQLAAAEGAMTKDGRIAHLEQAYRFAREALKEPSSERVAEPAG